MCVMRVVLFGLFDRPSDYNISTTMMGHRQQLGLLIATLLTFTAAQDYTDYQDYADSYQNEDNLYADHAMRQQEKVEGYVH